jgi:hypothetical protein
MIVLKIILWIIAIAAAVGVIATVADLLGKKSAHKPYGPYERFVKRGLDAFLATGALIVLSPVLLITAILVRVKLGSPVLFTQERPGRDGKIFKLYKFRSMLPPKDGIIDPAQDAARLTPFGKKLRSTSLDELPELINMIKGDMAVNSVTLLRDGKEEDYKTDAVFIAIGDDPSNDLAKDLAVALDDDGYIITDKNQATNVEGVYSAGDITGGVKQWIVACGEGAVAAISAYNDMNL